METLVWFVLLCVMMAGLLGLLAFRRRMIAQELPENIITLVLLQNGAQLESQLDALVSQVDWTDNELIRQVWLVDCSPDGALQAQCMALCQRKSSFRYCRLSEVVKFLET